MPNVQVNIIDRNASRWFLPKNKCFRDLTIEPTGVDLCVDCLASRVELGQHRATHKYRLVDNGGLQLLGRCVIVSLG